MPAAIAARFTVTDDTDRAAMMERASLAVLLAAAANPDSAGGRALATAITGAADQTFRDVVRDACTESSGFVAWLGESGSVPEMDLRRAFNMGIGLSLVVGPGEVAAVQAALLEAGEANAVVIGGIEPGDGGVRYA